MLNTPVLFLVFNRLETTKQVFAKIKEAKPRQLFIAADGARIDKIGEQEKVEEVRKFITDNIDWDCEVKTLFRKNNLGCGKAVSEGITWFFEHVEQGIILEDDCLPEKSFFFFCQEMLEKYKLNENIMHISGTNFLEKKIKIIDSYYFSKYPHIWGWATWKRAWRKYQFILPNYDKNDLIDYFKLYEFSTKQIKYWLKAYFDVKKIDTWDYQWMFSIWLNEGVSITPTENLVINIGFGDNATHTKKQNIMLPSKAMEKIEPIMHTSLKINCQADNMIFQKFCNNKTTVKNRVRNIAYKYFPKVWNFLKKNIKER